MREVHGAVLAAHYYDPSVTERDIFPGHGFSRMNADLEPVVAVEALVESHPSRKKRD